MKKIIFLVILVGCFSAFPSENIACSYIKTDIKLSKAEVRKYYLEQFKGAIFTGKVLSIKDVTVQQFDSLSLMKEVIVEVEEYWVGVEHPQMKIYTDDGEGSCGADFKIGEMYFLDIDKIGGLLWSTFYNSSKIDSPKDLKKKTKFISKIFGNPRKIKATD
ncbi:MAG TPA: hypothetical protein VF721_16740 [Pyrinomonadaceae bacterium]|jgi:hypothetical protein